MSEVLPGALDELPAVFLAGHVGGNSQDLSAPGRVVLELLGGGRTAVRSSSGRGRDTRETA